MNRIAPVICALLGAFSALTAAESSSSPNQPPPAPASAPAAPKPDYAKDIAASMEPTRFVTYREVGARELKLHVFQPKDWNATDKRACFLTVHGGGWAAGEPRRMYPIAAHYAERGTVGISIEYRLMQKGNGVTPLDCVSDGRAAIRYIKTHAAELGIDPEKIIANGGSAGAHVAAGMALFDGVDLAGEKNVSAHPAALVLYYPVIDTSTAGYGNKACGERWREISPLHQVHAGAPPAVIFHGTGDKTTPYAGAKAFQEAMVATGNRCELFTEPGAGHTYLMFEKGIFEQTLKRTDEFLASLKLLNP